MRHVVHEWIAFKRQVQYLITFFIFVAYDITFVESYNFEQSFILLSINICITESEQNLKLG